MAEAGEQLNSETSVKLREDLLAKDKMQKTQVDKFASELIDAMAHTKKFDEEYAKSGYADQFKNIKYVEREEDPELKKLYE